jgi:Fe-S-cluster containining protein
MWGSEIGIALFGVEATLFAPDIVVPVMVYGHINGDTFNGNNFIIDSELLSQLSLSTCPHYTEAGCAIYSKRPDICRAFPVTLDLSSFMLSGKIKTQIKEGACPTAALTLPTKSMRLAAKSFAENWTKLSSTILANEKSVYIMDIHRRVRYKLTKWLNIPLKD